MTTPTVALSYNLYVQQICEMAVSDAPTLVSGVMTGNTDFQAIVGQMLNYAEQRIQRDLDLNALETTGSYALTSGVNQLTIPTVDFVIVRTVEVTVSGVTVPLTPVAKEFLQNVYGGGSTLGTPSYFAPYGGDRATGGTTSSYIIVGPWPAGAYPVTVTGTIRAPSLYLYATTADAATKYTFISTWLADLLVQASMLYISEFQRNFAATSSDPQMLGAYEGAYQTLLAGARTEALRQRFAASAWSSANTSVAATPTR